MIEGVRIVPRARIPDERGTVMHMLKATDPEFLGFGEIYFSTVYPGVVKGWHRHTEMTLNYACVHGRIKLVLFDEPSLGLAPNLVERTFEIIKGVRAQGVTVVMVEQNAYAALELSDRSYVLDQGRVTMTGTGQDLLHDPHVKAAYLGA